MALGILEQLGLAATLIFALPVAVYGIQRLLDGQTALGAGVLVVAVLMVLLPRRLTSPDDVPGKVAEKAVGSVVKEPDEPSDDSTE
ncbi:DUF7533 family protein [Halobaculum lipolyticum]|uniref:Uncharacterized protein n=1 Tax=Halobaculum lipolyticum TaxID=3032001 RepID=A0ABD5WH18_9EURY|nr:hypothetical protein [Halobaculum sp. DT31]